MYIYRLFEDNSGNLHLAILNDALVCVWYLTDQQRDLVIEALAELRAGGDPIADGWDGGEKDPDAKYAEICDLEADRDTGVREIDRKELYRLLCDYRCGIVRDSAGYAQPVEPVSYWWNASASDKMPIYRLGGELYCAYGWNGEEWSDSFRVIDRWDVADDKKHELSPIYRYQDEDRDPDEDNDDDFEIVGFYVD